MEKRDAVENACHRHVRRKETKNKGTQKRKREEGGERELGGRKSVERKRMERSGEKGWNGGWREMRHGTMGEN